MDEEIEEADFPMTQKSGGKPAFFIIHKPVEKYKENHRNNYLITLWISTAPIPNSEE